MERWKRDAGQYSHQVTIQAKTVASTDSRGHPVRTYADLTSGVYAKIETPTGRRMDIAKQLVPTATHLIEMDFRVLSEENHRLTYYPLVTTLSAGANSGDTTITVASPYPLYVNSMLAIDSERMLVTGISGSTLTVTRAQEGTSAAAHSSGASVFQRRIFDIGHQEDVEERHVKLILTCTELKGATATV